MTAIIMSLMSSNHDSVQFDKKYLPFIEDKNQFAL